MEEEEKSFTQRLYGLAEQFVKTSTELYKLKAINMFAGVFAAVSTGVILWLIFLMLLLFLSIGGAFYFGKLLGAWHLGFFVMAGIYALFGLIIYIYRVKCVTEVIRNMIVKQIFKEKDGSDK